MTPSPPICGWILLIASCLAAAGCQRSMYEIEMKPDGKGVSRKVTGWIEREEDGKTKIEPLNEGELGRMAEAYGVEPPASPTGKQTFTGEFAGKLPDDVGGAGWYLHWENSLGSSTVYAERIRGDDDLTGALQRREAGVDKLVDLLAAWAETEFKDSEGYDSLHRFLDTDLRRDLKNLSLLWFSYTSLGREEADSAGEGMFRMGLYLAERDYFDPQEAPQVLRAMQEVGQGDPHRLLRFFQRLIARRMGVPADKPVPMSLRFLADPKQVKASLEKFLRKTERYQQLVEKWRVDMAGDPDLEPPQPTDVLGEQLHEAFPLVLLFAKGDQLKVRLSVPVRPMLTNGDYDKDAGEITWSRSIWSGGGDRPAPVTVLFATWSEPDRPAQETHFGKVVLEGNNLSGYCTWRAALTEDEGRQWDRFVQSLRPGPELEKQLRSFRFANEPPATVEPAYEGLADQAIDLISQGLTK